MSQIPAKESNQERLTRYRQEYPLILTLISSIAEYDNGQLILGDRDRAFQDVITMYADEGTLEEKAAQIEAYIEEEGLTHGEKHRLLGHLYAHRFPQGNLTESDQ